MEVLTHLWVVVSTVYLKKIIFICRDIETSLVICSQKEKRFNPSSVKKVSVSLKYSEWSLARRQPVTAQNTRRFEWLKALTCNPQVSGFKGPFTWEGVPLGSRVSLFLCITQFVLLAREGAPRGRVFLPWTGSVSLKVGKPYMVGKGFVYISPCQTRK